MPELTPDFFKRAVSGKYFARVTAKSNVVRISPDLSADFPDEATVNDALRSYRKLCTAFQQAVKPVRTRIRKSA